MTPNLKRPSNAPLLIAVGLISFGATMLLLGVFYSQDLAVLRAAPEMLWMAICGVPQDNGIAMPIILVLSEIATLIGLGMIVLPRVRLPARIALLALAALAIAAVGVSIAQNTPTEAEVNAARNDATLVFTPPKDVSDVTRAIQLTNSEGQPVTLHDLRGRPSLIFFGYTHCPDICPMAMSEFARVKKELGSSADGVNFVMISVDGERDTPEIMKAYVAAFDKDFIGLTAPSGTVRKLTDKFGAQFEIQKPEGTQAAYLIGHTALSYLLDAQGNWRAAFPPNTAPARVAREVNNVLKGK